MLWLKCAVPTGDQAKERTYQLALNLDKLNKSEVRSVRLFKL